MNSSTGHDRIEGNTVIKSISEWKSFARMTLIMWYKIYLVFFHGWREKKIGILRDLVCTLFFFTKYRSAQTKTVILKIKKSNLP